MPFGNESAWDQWVMCDPYDNTSKSPMPFGNESAWDKDKAGKTIVVTQPVTNAFRQ